MKSRAEIDSDIERLEKSLVDSAAEDARVARIEGVIKTLEAKRARLYDKAFPIGGTGRCLDATVFVSMNALDWKISELRGAGARAISGEPEEVPKEQSAATPRALPSTVLPLPKDWPAPDVNKDPFDGLEVLPSDTSALADL
jgi:hypothetical protein